MTAGKTQREVQHKHLIVYPRNICPISCRTIVFVHLISFFASRRQTRSEEVHFSFCFLYSASVSSKRQSYSIKNTVEPKVFFFLPSCECSRRYSCERVIPKVKTIEAGKQTLQLYQFLSVLCIRSEAKPAKHSVTRDSSSSRAST